MIQGEQQQQQQQQQSESPPPQSFGVNDNDVKGEEGATRSSYFGDNFRKSWQKLKSRRSAVSSFSASSISGVVEEEESQPNPNDGEEGDKNGIVDLLNEVDEQNGKSILLRRADQISISYYSRASKKGDDTTPPPSPVDANIILSGLVLKSAVDSGAPMIDGINENGLLTQHKNSCTLLDKSLQSTTFFNVGDVIEYACGVDCCRWGEPDNNDEKVDDAAAGDDELTGKDAATDGEKEVETVAQTNDISVHDKIETMRSATRSSDTTVRVSTTKSVNDPSAYVNQ
jgi:hypothetical protein